MFLLALVLVCRAAQACERVIQITLDFQENSAAIERLQIVRLANWLADVRDRFRYEDADVEGVASSSAPDSGGLARRRAEATTHALRSLFEGLPIHASHHAYPPADVRSNGNYAVIQLNPKDAPDCNPVPIPGFKSGR